MYNIIWHIFLIHRVKYLKKVYKCHKLCVCMECAQGLQPAGIHAYDAYSKICNNTGITVHCDIMVNVFYFHRGYLNMKYI